MTTFHSANMALDYQDIGSGPLTLVLLPGWCEPKTVFEPFIALAAERYRVISIDWRGHGLSSKAAEMSLAADDLLEDVRQLLTALRLDNVITLSVAHPAGWRSHWPKRCRSGYGAWCFSTGS
uniref:1H-3-hydroxy-4-oxoquinaldine 2,4-dioxygenase n=1 Tax=Serratia marcescens TaxID=615 RepID=A0A1C3HEG5_SERMA|nr:1H-3-hydroxy-4-oxoquinaldine 2,4-dioxygenase [Serratia marcescens]